MDTQNCFETEERRQREDRCINDTKRLGNRHLAPCWRCHQCRNVRAFTSRSRDAAAAVSPCGQVLRLEICLVLANRPSV